MLEVGVDGEYQNGFDNALVALSYYTALQSGDAVLKQALEAEYGALTLLSNSFALVTFLVHFNGEQFDVPQGERETKSVQDIRERLVRLARFADGSF